MEETTQVMNGPPPVRPQPTFNKPLPPPRNDKGTTRVIIAGIVALVIALVAAGTFVYVTQINGQSKVAATSTYQRQLNTALQPLIVANQHLSVVMNATDGSRSANNAIKVELKNAQTTLTTTQGAVGAIAVPAKNTALSQQTSQALTQENGYLQVISATAADPGSASAAQVQPSAANLVSALIPLDTVVPGAQKSVYGVTNFYNWAQSAGKIPHIADPPPVQPQVQPVPPQVQPVQPQVQPVQPTGGSRTVTDTIGNPTITAGSAISDGFARAVLTASADYYRDNGSLPDGVDLTVSSPLTGSSYNVYYTSDGSTVFATNTDSADVNGSNDVSFPASISENL